VAGARRLGASGVNLKDQSRPNQRAAILVKEEN